jgi:hypothetical protein
MNIADFINWQALLQWKSVDPENWEAVISDLIANYQVSVQSLFFRATEALDSKDKEALMSSLHGIEAVSDQVGAEHVLRQAKVVIATLRGGSTWDIEKELSQLDHAIALSLLRLNDYKGSILKE